MARLSEEQKTAERLAALIAMHTLVIDMNNEEAYMRWIYEVPDQATEEDLKDIAGDEQAFADVVRLFKSIWKQYISDGLYIGDRVY